MTGSTGPGRRAVHILEREQLIPLPLERTFAFFSRAENLEAITPPWLKFRLITKTPIEMKRGAIIEYNLRINGFPVYWRTLIAEYDPPHRFVDVQQKGPYKLWRHEHTFEAVEGATLMRDRVEYQIGFGVLGEIARRLFVDRQLRQIWDYREQRLAEILSQESAPL
ncbi:MAG: hypothetical protein KatS3mg024_2041 [Armatimonadota bacterium]|nr:MAG: hypothetical protein KatS3mg024_2041 [Armatimonadota bacterium]